jgi:hypothetical protein
MSPAGAFAIAEGGPVGTFAPSVSAIVIRWGIRGTVAWSVDPSLRTMPQREPSTVPIGSSEGPLSRWLGTKAARPMTPRVIPSLVMEPGHAI